MLAESPLWELQVHTATASMTIAGTVRSADRLDLVMESDPSLRSMPLWEAVARFDRGVSDAIGEVSIGSVVDVAVGADVDGRVVQGLPRPEMAYCHITMVVVSTEKDEDGCLRITARDARASFDRNVTNLSVALDSDDPVAVAVRNLGLPVTVSGDIPWVDGRLTLTVGDSPVTLSAIALDESRVSKNEVHVEKERGTYYDRGAIAYFPVLSRTATSGLAIRRTGILGEMRMDYSEVPDGVIMTYPRKKGNRDISAVSASVRFANRTDGYDIQSGGLVSVTATVTTRSFGSTQSRTAWNLASVVASKAAAVLLREEVRCRLVGNPNLEIGDRLSILCEDGERRIFSIIKHTLAYNGDLWSDLVMVPDLRYFRIEPSRLTESGGVRRAETYDGAYTYLNFEEEGYDTAVFPDGQPSTVWAIPGQICGVFPHGQTEVVVDGSRYIVDSVDDSASAVASAEAQTLGLTGDDFL